VGHWASDPLPGRNALTFFLGPGGRDAHWAHRGWRTLSPCFRAGGGSPPRHSPYTLFMCLSVGHGALVLSPCSLGTRERWCIVSPYGAEDSLRSPRGRGWEHTSAG